MRISIFVTAEVVPNANYRALMLVNVLRERGHEIVWCGSERDVVPMDALVASDVIHIYRIVPVKVMRILRRVQATGVALTWDNDDDIRALDERAPNYTDVGGSRGVKDFAIQTQMIQQADAVTTTSERLARMYRRYGGAEDVTVIENYLPREFVRTRRRRHKGVVIGWVAAGEHVVDAEELRVAETLEKVLQARPKARAVTLGEDLSLTHDRYEHRGRVSFEQLVAAMADFDIGIAPLADIPFNLARSSVKVKEYAAAGVPWLASPVGEYASYGPEQGGKLVGNDEWADALMWLIDHPVQRFVLGRRAKRWAETQTLRANAYRWEEVFERAIERARRRVVRARAAERGARRPTRKRVS
jgi:glycosyltransferase involved in cell wall biosynthesis